MLDNTLVLATAIALYYYDLGRSDTKFTTWDDNTDATQYEYIADAMNVLVDSKFASMREFLIGASMRDAFAGAA